MNFFRSAAVLAAFSLAPVLSPSTASAAPTAADLLSGLNAFVNGNFQTGHDVEGKVVVGGNLSGNGTFMNLGSNLGVALEGFGSVNVYGGAGISRFNANGLNIQVGGSNAGSNFSGAASTTYNAIFPVAKAEMWNQITTLSSGLAGLAATTPASALPVAGSNNAVLTATPTTVNGVSGVAVIDIAASLLGSYTGVAVNLNGASTVIINVAGNYTGKPNFMNGAAWRSSVIWNFEDATTVALGAQGIQGTVLAPLATVSNGTPIDGGLFAQNYVGNGELHYKPFTGTTDLFGSIALPPSGAGVAVAEPGSLLLLASGAAALGMLRRRKRNAA